MDKLNRLLKLHFPIIISILAISVAVGVLASIELMGYFPNVDTLTPDRIRAVHITLMLYGAIPLLLSFLPFFLIEKETAKLTDKIIKNLNLYLITWYLFLIMAVVTLLLGDMRGLPFYDFDYRLNFILSFSGLFYIIALFQAIKQYKKLPLWIKISLIIVIASPIALLALMNPINGAVKSTLQGPHGDNTLGMSFALLPLYYLVFKLLSKNDFKARWHIFWIIPFIGYIITLIYRFSFGALSYTGEWIAQWLTLLYIPLLVRWWRDSQIEGIAKTVLAISLIAFIFVDIEGNILFIPQLRWIFHRNDLVVGHAHIAMGLGVGFLALSMYAKEITSLKADCFIKIFATAIVAMAVVLTLAGITEAGWSVGNVALYWKIRTLAGILALISFVCFIPRYIPLEWKRLEYYNLIGFISDGVGAIFLLFGSEAIYQYLGWHYDRLYFVIFAFMAGTATVHLMALLYPNARDRLTQATAIIRLFVGAIFISLSMSGVLYLSGWGVGLYDLIFGYIYFLYIRSR